MEENNDTSPKSTRRNLRFLQPAPPGSPPNLQKAASRYITVEPILLLVSIGFGTTLSLLPQFYRYTIANERNVRLPGGIGPNGTCININISHPYYLQLQDVQAEVAYWSMVINLCGIIPSLFVAPVLGAWSDLVGRKFVLGLIVVGNIIDIITVLVVYYFTLPLWVLAISFFIAGITGGYGLLVAQCVAYVADVTTKTNRLLRIAVVQGSPVVGLGCTQLLVGYLIDNHGFGPPLWLSFAAYCIALLYIISPLLVETIDKEQKREESNLDKTASMAKAGIKNLFRLFKNNTYLRRWRIGFLYSIEFMNDLFNTTSVEIAIVYGLGPPFCWNAVLVAGYWTLVLFSSAAAILIFTKGFSLCLPDFWNLQLSLVFAIINGYLHAFVGSTNGLYVAAFVGCLRAMSQALIPTMIAKIVDEKEHGVVYAFEASVTNLAALMSPILLNNIYRKTVRVQPNFVFIMIGTLCFLPWIGTIILQIITRYAKRMQQRDREAGGKSGVGNPAMETKE